MTTIKDDSVRAPDFDTLADLKGGHSDMSTLDDASELLQWAIDSIDESLILIDLDYGIRAANQEARRRRCSSDEGTKHCYQLLHGRDHPCSAYGDPCPLEQIRQHMGKVCVTHQTSWDASEVLELTAWPLLDSDGGLRGILERARGLADNRGSVEKRALERRLESLSLVANGVAHDFGNVLTTLQGTVELGTSNPRASPSRMWDGVVMDGTKKWVVDD